MVVCVRVIELVVLPDGDRVADRDGLVESAGPDRETEIDGLREPEIVIDWLRVGLFFCDAVLEVERCGGLEDSVREERMQCQKLRARNYTHYKRETLTAVEKESDLCCPLL